jgi:hypothetical protein
LITLKEGRYHLQTAITGNQNLGSSFRRLWKNSLKTSPLLNAKTKAKQRIFNAIIF